MVGQDLVVTNRDRFHHQSSWRGRKNRQSIRHQNWPSVTFRGVEWKKEEVAKFKRSVHGWMSCEVHAVKHPVFTVTDRNGKFSLPRLPDGTYQVEFMHAKRGKQTVKVTIASKDPEPLEIEFK